MGVFANEARVRNTRGSLFHFAIDLKSTAIENYLGIRYRVPKVNNVKQEALLTDYYQLTMAYAHWKAGTHELPAVFTLYFRTNPFEGGYSLFAGLDLAREWLEEFHFSEDDIAFIGSLKNSAGAPLYETPFLDYLAESRLRCDIDSAPEGSVVFPNEPVVRVSGPIWQCQWLETPLLNILNFQTLVATKAARIVHAARGGEVIEFGLRRAQGFDGALSASRAAFLGGVTATSNTLAGKRFGIPLSGTQSHAWVMSFDEEEEAFQRYAEALPDRCIFLVDTFDSLRGLERAALVGKQMKAQGKTLGGIRLDSGDLAYLSQQARRILDAAGLQKTKIVATNELDEYLIQSLHLQGAKIDVWGVGTKLVTAYEQAAMSGVYKLVAVKPGDSWKYKIKVSDQPAKISNPGIPMVRRFFNAEGNFEGDLVYDADENPDAIDRIIDPTVSHRIKRIQPSWKHEELLEPFFRDGKSVTRAIPLQELQRRATASLNHLHPGHLRLEHPHAYPVGLSPRLAELKTELIALHSQKEQPL